MKKKEDFQPEDLEKLCGDSRVAGKRVPAELRATQKKQQLRGERPENAPLWIY